MPFVLAGRLLRVTILPGSTGRQLLEPVLAGRAVLDVGLDLGLADRPEALLDEAAEFFEGGTGLDGSWAQSPFGRHRRCWDMFTMFYNTDKPPGILHRDFSWVGIRPMSRDATIRRIGEATS